MRFGNFAFAVVGQYLQPLDEKDGWDPTDLSPGFALVCLIACSGVRAVFPFTLQVLCRKGFFF